MDGKARAYAVAVNVSDAEMNTEGKLTVHDGDMEAAEICGGTCPPHISAI